MKLRCYSQIFYFSKSPLFPFPFLVLYIVPIVVVVLYFVLVFVLENCSAPFSPTSDRPLISDEQDLLGGLLFRGLRGSGRVVA